MVLLFLLVYLYSACKGITGDICLFVQTGLFLYDTEPIENVLTLLCMIELPNQILLNVFKEMWYFILIS